LRFFSEKIFNYKEKKRKSLQINKSKYRIKILKVINEFCEEVFGHEFDTIIVNSDD